MDSRKSFTINWFISVVAFLCFINERGRKQALAVQYIFFPNFNILDEGSWNSIKIMSSFLLNGWPPTYTILKYIKYILLKKKKKSVFKTVRSNRKATALKQYKVSNFKRGRINVGCYRMQRVCF